MQTLTVESQAITSYSGDYRIVTFLRPFDDDKNQYYTILTFNNRDIHWAVALDWEHACLNHESMVEEAEYRSTYVSVENKNWLDYGFRHNLLSVDQDGYVTVTYRVDHLYQDLQDSHNLEVYG